MRLYQLTDEEIYNNRIIRYLCDVRHSSLTDTVTLFEDAVVHRQLPSLVMKEYFNLPTDYMDDFMMSPSIGNAPAV